MAIGEAVEQINITHVPMIIYHVALSVPFTQLVPMGLLINVYKAPCSQTRPILCSVDWLTTEQIFPLMVMPDPKRLLMHSVEMTHNGGWLLNLVHYFTNAMTTGLDGRQYTFFFSCLLLYLFMFFFVELSSFYLTQYIPAIV